MYTLTESMTSKHLYDIESSYLRTWYIFPFAEAYIMFFGRLCYIPISVFCGCCNKRP